MVDNGVAAAAALHPAGAANVLNAADLLQMAQLDEFQGRIRRAQRFAARCRGPGPPGATDKRLQQAADAAQVAWINREVASTRDHEVVAGQRNTVQGQ
eukprot:12743388-Prorocentrum_lima.AAC.1